MPPSKVRVAADDSRSEASSTRERPGITSNTPVNNKGRRFASGIGTGSSLRDSTNNHELNTTVKSVVPNAAAQEGTGPIQWASFEPSILHSYRQIYRLNTPSAYNEPYNQLILSRPGIGRLSPTMARRKEQRRQANEQLATAVRKHFNGLGVQESDVIVEFLYKVRYQDKAFRMRFAPQRAR